MKTCIILSLGTLLTVLSAEAQAPDYRFGKVSEEELRMDVYDLDPDAEAVILYEESSLTYNITPQFSRMLDYRVRIKILKPEGSGQADVSLPYTIQKESYSGVDAVAYNLVNGKIVKTPLKKQYVFRETVDEERRLLKFSVPEVRAGTVIEYRYRKNSENVTYIPPMRFQHEIPVVRAKMSASIPEFLRFNLNTKGYVRIDVHEASTSSTIPGTDFSYGIREIRGEAVDIPALKREPFVWCLDDFRGMLEFELSQIAMPHSMIRNFATSWKDVNKTLAESSFEQHLRIGNPFREEVAAIRVQQSDPLRKAHDVLRLVQSKMAWDETYRLFSENPRAAAKKGAGSSADINFVLAAALKDAGFQVTPILLNPRHAGRLPYTHATIDKINTFILRIPLADGGYAYLDGTDPHSDVNLLPVQLLADRARIYGEDGPDGWCDLSRISQSVHSISMILEFDSDLALAGEAIENFTAHAALDQSRAYTEANTEEEYVEKLETSQHIRIDDLSIEGIGTSKVTRNYRMIIAPEQAGEFLYLNATIQPFLSANPFKETERMLPVEQRIPMTYTIRSSIRLPEGYALEEAPKNASFVCCDGDLSCRYISQVSNGCLQFSFVFTMKRVVFLPTEYEELSAFYGMVVQLNNSRIVLRKAQ